VSEEEKESLGNFVRRYLKIYFFEKDYEDVTEADVKEDCYSILDLLEMQDSYTLHEPNNYLIRFFEDTNLYRSFLVKDAFDEIKRFQALDQLSEVEKSERLNQMDMMYHNYIAIINADGDRMSDTISRLLDEGRSITELSKKLLDFGNDAVIIAKEYAARIIFIGGDDILIFAPIKYGIRTVFAE
jgi:CRISPR-associated protein Cmr2